LLRGVLDASPEGIVVCEAGPGRQSVVYVNAAFERMSGYSAAELLGRDLRCLQGSDREQDGRNQLRAAIAQGEPCRVLLRNYRKDGSRFWNEMLVQPLRGAGGAVTHLVGFHRDVTEREQTGERRRSGLPSWLREDRLSGLCSRAYFEELLQHDWQIGGREARPITLIAFDIDDLGSYNDTFGRAAGDACIRRVAGVIATAFKRGADVVARWEGGRIVAMVRNAQLDAVPAFALGVTQRVLGQHIHHPRASGPQKFVTVSCGAASQIPAADRGADALVQAAMTALARAKQNRSEAVSVQRPEHVA
jgi:diguanylate cyclase (GGDEF)-like protein/PAS domain S-box-containing protein